MTNLSNSCVLNEYHLYCSGRLLSHTEGVALQVLFYVLIVVTLIGNTLVFCSIVYFQQLQTLTNAFILSLALTDFLVGLLIMPLNMVNFVYNCWFFSRWYCEVHSCLDYILCSISIAHLCCIAYDRYIAICHPLFNSRKFHHGTAGFMLAVCWVGPVIFAFPIMLGWNKEGIEGLATCPDNCGLVFNTFYTFLYTVFGYFVPCSAMVLAYAKIYQVARRQARRVQAVRAADGRRLQREHNATRTLGIIMGLFMCLWVPSFCIILMSGIAGVVDVNPFTWCLLLFLGYSNSALNPVLYAVLNQPFRKAFIIIISGKIIQRNMRGTNLFMD